MALFFCFLKFPLKSFLFGLLKRYKNTLEKLFKYVILMGYIDRPIVTGYSSTTKDETNVKRKVVQ